MLTVYEAMNVSLKERYVSVCALPLQRLQERNKTHPPPYPPHWDFQNQQIVYNELMQTSTEKDAQGFIKDYQYSTPLPGWRVL